MARLTQEQALQTLVSPKNAPLITQAREHEERLIMHTEPILNGYTMPNNALRNFLTWVENILPKDKYKRFVQLLSFPLDTVESTKAIFDDLSKVYDAQDSFKKYDFVSSEIAEEFLQYTDTLKDDAFWRTQGFNALRNRINSLIVVDLPSEQKTFRPEPYYYMLKTPRLIDVDYKERTGNVEYCSFYDGKDRAIVICDEWYRVFIKPDNGDWKVSSEFQHSFYTEGGELSSGLGYCPVEPFYKIAISGTKQTNKRAPITDVLGKLDWLLFWRTSVKYFELYGAWPIIVTYEQECNYQDNKGNQCDDGKIRYRNEGEEFYTSYDCPACKSRELIGPGSAWTVKFPRTNDKFNMMESPAKIIEIPVDTLKHVVERIGQMEDEIYLDCVGYDGEALNKQAINNNQVQANFESREAVLDTIKREFERAQKFALDTVARLRYGNYFVKSTVDWGNEYFIKSLETLYAELKEARENGMPMYHINVIQQRIIQTKAKNNPDQQKRDYILSYLEPYPEMGFSQIQTLGLKEDDPLNYLLKLNFTTFVQQFEREQMNIVEFGSLIPFNTKIELITKKLLEYATTKQRQAASARKDAGGNESTAGTAGAGE